MLLHAVVSFLVEDCSSVQATGCCLCMAMATYIGFGIRRRFVCILLAIFHNQCRFVRLVLVFWHCFVRIFSEFCEFARK